MAYFDTKFDIGDVVAVCGGASAKIEQIRIYNGITTNEKHFDYKVVYDDESWLWIKGSDLSPLVKRHDVTLSLTDNQIRLLYCLFANEAYKLSFKDQEDVVDMNLQLENALNS